LKQNFTYYEADEMQLNMALIANEEIFRGSSPNSPKFGSYGTNHSAEL